MCQLLAMNSAEPAAFSFSFRGFCSRGGLTDCHADGWGLAIYEGRGLRIFLESAACARSPVARFVRDFPMKTHNMVAHIRCATHGLVSLDNTHPFQREMWGINWCFAHNGDVSEFSGTRAGHHVVLGKAAAAASDVDDNYLSYHAVGDTDSEALFCAILNALKAKFHELPSLAVLHQAIQDLCNEIVARDEHSICNFLLACGEYTLFAYSYPGQRPGSDVWNGLYYITREPPFSKAKLVDEDYSIDFSQCSTAADRISIIATKPLTDEAGWKEMAKGELLMFDKGVPHSSSIELDAVEAEGRGLASKCLEKARTLTEIKSLVKQNLPVA